MLPMWREGLTAGCALLTCAGAGKSLCFQLPPLLSTHENVFTVVIGPLLALMKEQVMRCLELGIETQGESPITAVYCMHHIWGMHLRLGGGSGATSCNPT